MITQAMYERWHDNPPQHLSNPQFTINLRSYILMRWTQIKMDGRDRHPAIRADGSTGDGPPLVHTGIPAGSII